jgi:hypothetical protein
MHGLEFLVMLYLFATWPFLIYFSHKSFMDRWNAVWPNGYYRRLMYALGAQGLCWVALVALDKWPSLHP